MAKRYKKDLTKCAICKSEFSAENEQRQICTEKHGIEFVCMACVTNPDKFNKFIEDSGGNRAPEPEDQQEISELMDEFTPEPESN